MLINELYIIHISCNLIATYVIFKLMNLFFLDGSENKELEFLSYVVYFVLALVCYSLIHIPIIMLIYNLFYFSILTINYKANF